MVVYDRPKNGLKNWTRKFVKNLRKKFSFPIYAKIEHFEKPSFSKNPSIEKKVDSIAKIFLLLKNFKNEKVTKKKWSI